MSKGVREGQLPLPCGSEGVQKAGWPPGGRLFHQLGGWGVGEGDYGGPGHGGYRRVALKRNIVELGWRRCDVTCFSIGLSTVSVLALRVLKQLKAVLQAGPRLALVGEELLSLSMMISFCYLIMLLILGLQTSTRNIRRPCRLFSTSKKSISYPAYWAP